MEIQPFKLTDLPFEFSINYNDKEETLNNLKEYFKEDKLISRLPDVAFDLYCLTYRDEMFKIDETEKKSK